MKNDAIYLMQQGRENKIKRLNRAIKRSWEYKDGKKKAAKLAVTVGLTTAFVAVGVATHGAGIAVVAALAAGSYVVGKMNDTAFAKLYGRQYTGGHRTREFVEHIKNNPVAFDTEEQSKSLASRAHKTVRRACQHYRTALDKLGEFTKKVKAKPKVTSCDEAAERITALLQVKRHLDKSWLYIHPGFFLSNALFKVYSTYWHIWDGTHTQKKVEDRISEQIVDLMKKHDEAQQVCGSDKCYWESGKNGEKSEHTPAAEPLWSDSDLDHRVHELEEAEEHLRLDPTVEVPSLDTNLSADAQALYTDTKAKYLHRSVVTKLKHSVTNTWDRKTKSEKVAFGVAQVVSAGATAGGAAGSVHIPEGLEKGIDVLLEYGKEAINLGAEGGGEAAADSVQGGKSAVGSAQTGKQGQEALQKAAIHLWEMMQVQEKLNALKQEQVDFPEGDVCGSAMAKLYEIYRLKHHLVKTQTYLGETIEVVAGCSKELHTKIKLLKQFHNEIVIDINSFLKSGNHSTCKACYKDASTAVAKL
jgi:hypothetical protein